ncbi:hypothetical protein PHYSODRAFT_536408 [Phytophthora sojae]|uniref:Uncharacterized protein n=1 Tax=Phytophthora sojae (strain P6497) TaxID=1094619 RepID=G5AJ58_PHYSP|nr:hypothetical protein PHYSODRAFT_507021 [Phytophthora sojae]XP_009540109.1 hypothetical protein PHYSODRAFT_536408 [Phytophthora sojae]EGZ04446.1 hypothetical protein PHYSODRAFT_536408 [Phytophthora sojae]EGZ14614.1 hypothetical protein PHYSODRAFT_507021 [Phytophthora sojae]|eukprot:XP_009528363.1 hypothetical protein PHYSODRAFT_507021 [Phytophthora sojae]
MADVEGLLRTNADVEVANARTRVKSPRSRIERTLKLLDSSRSKTTGLALVEPLGIAIVVSNLLYGLRDDSLRVLQMNERNIQSRKHCTFGLDWSQKQPLLDIHCHSIMLFPALVNAETKTNLWISHQVKLLENRM